MDLICINDEFSQEQINAIPNRPIKGNFYTFRDYRKTIDGQIGIMLFEIENPPLPSNGNSFEPGFNSNRFTTLLGQPLSREMIRQAKKDLSKELATTIEKEPSKHLTHSSNDSICNPKTNLTSLR